MESEITKRDRAHNTAPLVKKTYGRGSKKVTRKWCGEDTVYTLCNYRSGFWTALTPGGLFTSISDASIEKILVKGKWLSYTANPREWQRIY